MNPMDYLWRLFHILPAVFLAGGVLYMWSALVPGIKSLDDDTRKSVLNAVRGKWAKVVMICSALLLVTGLYNAVMNIKAYEYALPYHAFVLVKLLLGLGVMFITARLSGRSASAEKFRENIAFWANINAILVIVLIACASLMRVTEKTPKISDDETIPAVVVEENG